MGPFLPTGSRSPTQTDRWLEAETADALALQRPLPDDALRIVAKGEKEDATPQSFPGRRYPVEADSRETYCDKVAP